jgi:hypothetical protein
MGLENETVRSIGKVEVDIEYIPKRYTDSKDAWSKDPRRLGLASIDIPPPPKKSCLDKAKNSLARTVAQIRSGHWRSAIYLKRIRKSTTEHCWFCKIKDRRVTRPHVLLHCPDEGLTAGRSQAWGTGSQTRTHPGRYGAGGGGHGFVGQTKMFFPFFRFLGLIPRALRTAHR